MKTSIIVRERRILMNELKKYFSELWCYRDFWFALARVDLRNRFRRSRVGVLWVVIHPLIFTVLLGLVFQFVFKQPFIPLTNYIFSGMVLWNWITESTLQGSNTFVQSQAFIRQKRLPLLGYVFRTLISSLATFLLAFAGMIIWFLVTGHVPGMWSMLLPVHIFILGVVIFPLIAISAVLGTKYRDYQQMLMIFLQALWFVSPVFMDKKIFLNPGLQTWDAINPVSSMLALIRSPLLDNQPPDVNNYLIILIFAVVAWAIALQVFRQNEQDIIYYL